MANLADEARHSRLEILIKVNHFSDWRIREIAAIECRLKYTFSLREVQK